MMLLSLHLYIAHRAIFQFAFFIGEIGMLYFYADTRHDIISLTAALSLILRFITTGTVGDHTE
ncbi:hypothetical protein K25_27795 [Klebsiella pneumoniae]|nr:hypothetical protein K25_27795 [Klebsiella pneumoniae]